MVGKHELGSPGHAQPFFDLHPASLEHLDLVDQGPWIEDHSIPEQAPYVRIQGPRGNEVEDELLISHQDRVPGVGPTLVPRHQGGLLGQYVGDLAFPLVAPLDAHEHNTLSLVVEQLWLPPDGLVDPMPWSYACARPARSSAPATSSRSRSDGGSRGGRGGPPARPSRSRPYFTPGTPTPATTFLCSGPMRS